MTLLAAGRKAPDFTLTDQDGNPFTLSSYLGRPVVLFFYPKANTPACTLEAQDFTALLADFTQLGAMVIGVSADDPAAQCKFRDKQGLKTLLLSDPDLKMLKRYGVWGEKLNYGKTYMGIFRSTFIIGANGKILDVFKVARTKGHAEKVLERARELLK